MKNVLIVEDLGAIRSISQLPFEARKTLPARRFNFIITDINSLKLISFKKSSSLHTMQAVVE